MSYCWFKLEYVWTWTPVSPHLMTSWLILPYFCLWTIVFLAKGARNLGFPRLILSLTLPTSLTRHSMLESSLHCSSDPSPKPLHWFRLLFSCCHDHNNGLLVSSSAATLCGTRSVILSIAVFIQFFHGVTVIPFCCLQKSLTWYPRLPAFWQQYYSFSCSPQNQWFSTSIHMNSYFVTSLYILTWHYG